MSNIPPLFKFVESIDAVEAMLSGSLKFCAINELNDPTELLPLFSWENVFDSLNEMRTRTLDQQDLEDLKRQESLMKKLSPETIVVSAPDSVEQYKNMLDMAVYENKDYMFNMYKKTVDLFRQRIGVLSLTEKWMNFPMWAHYAKNASGVCIGFNDVSEPFTGDESGLFNTLFPVTYSTPRPSVTFDPNSYKNIFLSKMQDWAYEREWRVATALSDCTKKSETLYIKLFNKDIIKEVICGWKMPPDNIQAIIQAKKKMGSSAIIWQTEVDINGQIKKHKAG